MTWLRVSGGDNRCELCHEPIQFRHVYAENTPALLPLSEFVTLLLPRVKGFLEHTARIAVAVICWFVLLPLQTAWCLKTCLLVNVSGLGALPAAVDPSVLQPLLVTWWVGVALNFLVLMVSHLAFGLTNFLAKELLAVERNAVVADQQTRPGEHDQAEDQRVDDAAEGNDHGEELIHIPRRDDVLGVGVVGEGGEEEDVLQDLFVPSILKCFEMMMFNAAFFLAVVCLPAMVGQAVLYIFSVLRHGLGGSAWREFVMSLDIRSAPELSGNLAVVLMLDLDEELLRRSVAMGGEMMVGYLALSVGLVCAGAGYCLVHYNHRTVARVQRAFTTAVAGAIDWNMRVLKYSVIVGVLFCFLPNAIGWLIDLSTLRVFDCSLAERMAMCSDRVLFCTAVHWLLGFLFVLHAAAIISEARALLNIAMVSDYLPDFSNDLADFGQLIELEDNPHAPPARARNLANMSLMQLLERTLLYTLYCLLGVMLYVLIPVNFGHYIVPGSHPLKFQYENTIFDVHVSMEMLFFHFVLPFALERLRHRNLTKLALKLFFENACILLELRELLTEEADRRVPALVHMMEMSMQAENEAEQRSQALETRRMEELRSLRNDIAELDNLLEKYVAASVGRAPTVWLEMMTGFRCSVNRTLLRELYSQTTSISSRRLSRLKAMLEALKARQAELRRVASRTIEAQSVSLLQTCMSSQQTQLLRLDEWAEAAERLNDEAELCIPSPHLPAGAVDESGAEVDVDLNVDSVWSDVASDHDGSPLDISGSEREPVGSSPAESWDYEGFSITHIPKVFTYITASRSDVTVSGSDDESLECSIRFKISRVLDSLQNSCLENEDFSFSAPPAPGSASSHLRLPFPLRVLMLGLTSAVAVALFFSTILHVPLLVGGAILRMAGLSSGHDLYCIVAGTIFLWAVIASGQQVVAALAQSLRAADVSAVMYTLSRYCLVILKVALVGGVWLTAVPFLVGILFEVLFLVPALTQYNETPFYPLMQSWAMGLVFLKMWARGVLIGAVGGDEWRVKLERVLELGFERLDVVFVFGQIIGPILLQLLDQLLVPYFLGKIAGLCFQGDYLVQSCIMRFAYIAYLAIRLAYRALTYAARLVVRMHNEFRDSRYLLGTELANRNEVVSR